MPYPALLGSTVDTRYCQSTFFLGIFPYSAQCLVLSGPRYAPVTEFTSLISLSWCRGRFPWSCCSADHSNSPVAVLGQGDGWPCCAGRVGFLMSFTCLLCATTGARLRFAVAVLQQGCSHHRRSAEAFPWSGLLSDQRDSAVAGQSDRRSCCAVRAVRAAFLVVVQTCKLWFPTVAVLGHVGDMPVVVNDRSWRCRRCSSCGFGRRCEHAATRCLATVKVPQTQFIAGVCGHFPSKQRQVRTVAAVLGRPCLAGMVAAMRGSLLQFCSIFRPPSIWTLRPRVAGTPGV